MSNEEFEPSRPESRTPWGIIGAVAFVGAAAAALLLLKRKRRDGRCWTIDDLMNAADRTADKLEQALLGEKVRAS